MVADKKPDRDDLIHIPPEMAVGEADVRPDAGTGGLAWAAPSLCRIRE